MTKVYKFDNDMDFISDDEINKNQDYINEAAKTIKNGGTVVFPTETVYGLGADALNSEAVKKIFVAKGRPQDNPLIVHVASKKIDYLVKEVPELAKKLINKFWPGPLTIILYKNDIIPDVTSANLKTIGIRMPDNKIARELIKASNTPIAAPSANISGRPSPTDLERCFQDLEGRVDIILGGSSSKVGVESTIIDCTVNPPTVLRPGGVTLEMLQEIDPTIMIDKAIMKKPTKDLKPKAPGMKYRHYAPKAKVTVVSGDNQKVIDKINELIKQNDNKKIAVLISSENVDKYNCNEKIILGSKKRPEEIAHNLFEALRTLDDKNIDIVFAEAFEEKGIGIAIMNRLKKAAGYDIIEV